jgi:hypothetical protein
MVGGQELSGGQWQRIALARAFHRPAGLLVRRSRGAEGAVAGSPLLTEEVLDDLTGGLLPRTSGGPQTPVAEDRDHALGGHVVTEPVEKARLVQPVSLN